MRTLQNLTPPPVSPPPSGGTGEADHLVCEAIDRGDKRAALEMLMDGYGDCIHRFCVDLVREVALAEDIVQTVFVHAFQHLDRYERRSSVRTWLFTIARNRCYDELRRGRRWRRLLVWPGDLPDPPAPAPLMGAAQLEDEQWRAAFSGCLGCLDLQSRECVVLRFGHGMSYEEIAKSTGTTAGALRVRVNRAIHRLRACLEKKGVMP